MSPKAGWILQEEVVPRLRSIIPQAVSLIGCEDAEELIADATVIAARMIISAEKNRKQFGGSTIAYYAVQQLKSGRRANGSSSVDVMASATQIKSKTQISSLEETVATDESGNDMFDLHDTLSSDTEDPSVIAGRKMDWDLFCASLSEIELLVIEFITEGKTLRDVARRVGLSDSTLGNYRRKLALKIREFIGAEILNDVVRLPRWRHGLNADKELMACRRDRRTMA